MTDEEFEALGETEMCEQCPAFNITDPRPCPFWLKRQPCPVELGMAEVTA